MLNIKSHSSTWVVLHGPGGGQHEEQRIQMSIMYFDILQRVETIINCLVFITGYLPIATIMPGMPRLKPNAWNARTASYEMNNARKTFQQSPTQVETIMRRSTGTKVKFTRPTSGQIFHPANFNVQNFCSSQREPSDDGIRGVPTSCTVWKPSRTLPPLNKVMTNRNVEQLIGAAHPWSSGVC